jgi:hypothetical protein
MASAQCTDDFDDGASTSSAHVKTNCAKSAGKSKGTCPICQSIVKFPSHLQFLNFNQIQAEKEFERRQQEQSINVLSDKGEHEHDHAKSKQLFTSRTYLDEFLSSSAFTELCSIEYHGVNNMHKVRKEVSESYGILHAVRSCCTALQCSMDQVFMIDLCSGKSLTTALCGILYPEGQFLAVDKLPAHLVPHYVASNTTYWSRDIMRGDFKQDLQTEVEKHTKAGRIPVLVGMHLCGALSEQAINLFETIPGLRALVLSPCCLPKKSSKAHVPVRAMMQDKEAVGEEATYEVWSNYLTDIVERVDGVEMHRKYRDLEMNTTKNCIISAARL